MNKLRQDINELVDEFILSVESIDKVFKENLDEDKFHSLKKSLSKELEELSNYLKNSQDLEWETLNVAFFGETNAGKSTLIEALIKGDGKSIGTGEKDFTKEVKIYPFDKEINLIDMPGIEGDEKKVEDKIWEAVSKAHIIFYVFSHTKEPERNTLSKICKYLNKNTNVYGLINVRAVCPPKVLENLLKKNVSIVKERSEKLLKKYLGDIFKDIFVVHSLYAFFSRAKSIPEDLVSKYKIALKHYPDKKKLEEVSNIKKN